MKQLAKMYGISPAFDKNGKSCCLIRLKYKHGKPSFQKVVYGEPDKILEKSIKIRDTAVAELALDGWIPGKTNRQIRPNCRNTSGVTGVRFGREKSKSSGWYRYWQVSWTEWRDGKKWPRAKSFYFSKFTDHKEAFFAAVGFRSTKELELYGYTLISPLQVDQYWQIAKQTIA